MHFQSDKMQLLWWKQSLLERLEDMEKGIDALEKSNIKILTDDDIKEI